ncbi:HNH endonuclease [Gordonia phage DatBoi]|nr:HNH endonuclease [Gordonia phage DatBoi]
MAWADKTPRPKSIEFQINRPIRLEMDGHACQIQGPECTLTATEVDHKIPVAEGGGDDLENLQSVCPECHKPKTHAESRRSYRRNREKAKHPWTRIKHPGLID